MHPVLRCASRLALEHPSSQVRRAVLDAKAWNEAPGDTPPRTPFRTLPSKLPLCFRLNGCASKVNLGQRLQQGLCEAVNLHAKRPTGMEVIPEREIGCTDSVQMARSPCTPMFELAKDWPGTFNWMFAYGQF